MLGQGDTEGVFQLESSGMKQVLVGLQPQNLSSAAASWPLSYQSLFPREWFPHYTVTPETMTEHLLKFWEAHST